ncbi:hypothetical protein [Shewanella sp. MF08487]|uniref:hypothetical protein n=1 Tax=Shewanella sp. MF08487 TaxID=3434873 RepID=UPI003D7B8124
MGLPVTVYRWDDAGAPQLGASPTPSEIIAVLKACLVTGYGAKAGLGWSVAFEDTGTQKIAFRNSTVDGSGGFVQYWSVDGSNAINRTLYVKSGSAMSALDNFTHPSLTFVHFNSENNSHWVIIGTSVGFYMIPKVDNITINYTSSIGNEVTYFVGDIDSNYNNDMTRFTICAQNFTSNMTSVNYSHSLAYGGVSGCGVMYGVDGNTKSIPYSANSSPISVQEANSNYTLEDQGINPVLLPVMIVSPSPSTTDIDNLQCMFSGKNPYYRGVIPGLYALPFAGYGNATWPTVKNFGGKDCMLLRGYFTTMWVNIVEWY